jgi:hypothetical protein
LSRIVNIPFNYEKIKKAEPISLYRFFDKTEYCESFYTGDVRLSKITKYKEREDVRADKTEGEANYLVHSDRIETIPINSDGTRGPSYFKSGNMNCGNLLGNQYYILCFSEANNNEEIQTIKERFKATSLPYIKITDPILFTDKIIDSLEKNCFYNCIIGGEWFQVEYTKGHIREKTSDPFDMLQVYQKPADYSVEQEWRIAFCMNQKGSMNNHEHLVIDENEDRIIKLMAKKHQVPVSYYKKYPHLIDESFYFEAEWKTDIEIQISDIHECCELLRE